MAHAMLESMMLLALLVFVPTEARDTPVGEESDVAKFQIKVWLSLAFVFMALGAVYAMLGMA